MSCDNLGGAGSLREVGKWRAIKLHQPPFPAERPEWKDEVRSKTGDQLQRNHVVPHPHRPRCSRLHPLLSCRLHCREEGCLDRR